MRRPTTGYRLATCAAVLTAAGSLAACGPDSAPGVQAPPAVSATPSSSTSGGGTSTSAGGSTSSGGSSSGATGADAGLCSAAGTNYGPQYSTTVPLKSFGTAATINDQFDRQIEVSAKDPRVVSSPAERAPDDGYEYVAVDVRARMLKGSSFYFSYISFSLFDPARTACAAKSFSNVIPSSQQLNGVSMSDTVKEGSGTLIYQVKAGSDLKQLTLLFSSTSSGAATAGWKS